LSRQHPHTKLINAAARETFQPLGLVQKGRSRMWRDDRAWWLGIVEFQPSSWTRGSYLNVGVNWLWNVKDWHSFDFGYRRYVPLDGGKVSLFGEGTVGIAFIDEIDVLLAAPQSNIVFNQTDFYDQTAALTLGVSVGVLFPVADKVDLTAQLGLRRVSGLADVDQFEGTGLDNINDDSARLTFPVVVGVRFRF
jgi:hypothetical protein